MSFVASCVALVLALAPGEAPVAGATPIVVDMAEHDAAVAAGQTFFAAGEYLSAARTWTAAARKLPPIPEQRGNLAALHGNVADAYDRAGERSDDPALLREALAILDEQDARFAAAYPDEPHSPRITAIRERLGGRLQTVAGKSVDAPLEPIDITWTERPVVRPWRPLAIGGGVTLAAGAAMAVVFSVGLARTKHYENNFQSAALGCQVHGDSGGCGDYYGTYRTATAMTAVGVIVAPALLGAGAAMVIVAAKRRRAARPDVTPQFGRDYLGLSLQGRF